MTEKKRFTVPLKYSLSHSKIQCDGKPLTNGELVRILNANDGAFLENFYLKEENNELQKENRQLKQRCKELRNDLIDHSALINMLEKARGVDIEDMIWNTMDYRIQTEFDDDFADYREDAKRKWRECLKD